MQISIITAIDRNHVIGIANRLPWSLPADLLRFKRVTWGKPIIMGRNTHESIGRPLPGRTNIVLSRQKTEYLGCFVYNNLEDALLNLHGEKEVFIIGGENLYTQAITQANRLYLTIIHHNFKGDAFFPKWDHGEWEIIEQEEFIPDAQNKYSYTFQTLKRKEL